MFVVEAADESADGEGQAGVAGFQMPTGVLQEVILLQRCVVVAAETVLEFRQPGGEEIHRLRLEELAETLQ